MTKKKRPQPPPPLKPHTPNSFDGKQVAVVRVPVGTSETEKRKALKGNWQLANRLSRPYINDWENYN